MTFQGTWDLDAKWTWQSSRLVEPWCSYVWHAYWSCKSFHQLFFFTILLLIFYHELWFFGKRWNVNCMLKYWMAWGIYVDFENWCPDNLLDCRPHCYRKHRTQPVVINVPCVTVFVVLNSAVIKWMNQSKCGLGGPKEPFWGRRPLTMQPSKLAQPVISRNSEWMTVDLCFCISEFFGLSVVVWHFVIMLRM